jgi:hypothetical protein
VLVLYIAFKGLSAASIVWRDVSSKSDLFLYPFFGLASHVVSALGEVIGLVKLAESSPRPPDPARTG